MKYFLLLLGLTVHFDILAQCCSAGNPVISDPENTTASLHQMKISLFYKYSSSDQYFMGSDKYDFENPPPGLPVKVFYNFLEFNLNYGVTSKLDLGFSAGYFFDKTTIFQSSQLGSLSGKGFGDAGINLKYHIYNNKKLLLNITALGNIKVPVGEFDVMEDGILLPINIQPSSGCFKYQMGALISKAFTNPKFGLSGYGSAEFSGMTHSDYFKNLKYGNLYIVSVSGNYTPIRNLGTGLQLRTEIKNRDQEDGIAKEDTGNEVVFISPALSYSLKRKLNFFLSIDIPVYRRYNEIQMANTLAVSARLAYNIKIY